LDAPKKWGLNDAIFELQRDLKFIRGSWIENGPKTFLHILMME